jgi:hypothetical protein
MTQQSTDTKSDFQQIRAAQERIKGVLSEAQTGFEEARKAGDIEAAQKWHETLKTEGEAFTRYMGTLTAEQLFLAKYNVEIINDHTASVVLPTGTSRYDFVKEAEPFCKYDDGRDFISANMWMRLSGKPGEAPCEQPTKIAVDVCVDGLTIVRKDLTLQKDYANQDKQFKKRGLVDPTPEDVTVAIVALVVAGKKPYLEADWVSTNDVTLIYARGGLHELNFMPTGYGQRSAASAYYDPTRVAAPASLRKKRSSK